MRIRTFEGFGRTAVVATMTGTLAVAAAAVEACGSSSSADRSSDAGATANDGSLASSGNDNGANDGGASVEGNATDAAAASTTDGGVFPFFLPGTNLSGAEFNPAALPGKINYDYTYPTHAEVDEFFARGFRVFRFPFLWERMQPTLGQMFNADELARLTDLVNYATRKGAYALLDPHDYGRYRGLVIGADAGDAGMPATRAQFASFWATLATSFAANDHAIFGLINEPNHEPSELWLADANAAIAAIRNAGATNVIFVPGNGYTGAGTWSNPNAYGTPNATVMLGVVDPLDRYVFEVHEYFDTYSTGDVVQCGGPSGSSRFTDLTAWLELHHKKAFLGEFGASVDPSCNGFVDDALGYIDQHRDVWVGWTWFSAGPWWGSYMFNIEPYADGGDRPQTATLLRHL